MQAKSFHGWTILPCLIAVLGLSLGASLASAQSTSAKSSSTTASTSQTSTSQFKSVDDRVRIDHYNGPPIFLEETKQVVPPSLTARETMSDKFPDNTLRVERQIAKYSDDHFESDGFYREFHPGGKKFVEGQFQKGRREGDWTYYFDNGQINRIVTYKNGQLHGQWEVNRADGTLAAKQSFAAGLRDGTWVIYDDTGKQPLREERYADKGKVDGVWKTWFPNGKLQQEASFKLGLRDGVSIQFKDDGSKASESNWVAGKLDGQATLYRPEGKTIQQFKNGLLVSEKKEK